MTKKNFSTEITAKEAIEELKDEVFEKGRSVVPLLGAGISSEAGVPRLAEVTEYLAKTKAYIRHKVYAGIPKANLYEEGQDSWQSTLGMPSFSTSPRSYLRQFGWPNPYELDSDLRYWLEYNKQINDDPASTALSYPQTLHNLITGEILDSVNSIDRRLVCKLLDYSKKKTHKEVFGELKSLDGISGKFWKILLTEMTRSSPELVDTLFQTLTRKRFPATSHRFLALITPILRLRLFLTTNFDNLTEDALRAEGHQPTVFEVADGLSLPHPKLMHSGLSIIKLHGGAFGLLVGDRLDTPLDEETRERFRAYLPHRPILLVIGFGGDDQRVLDMLELVRENNGIVYWIYFQSHQPYLLKQRFGLESESPPDWIKLASSQDPGTFLRQMYNVVADSYPSSSLPFKFSHLPPVLSGETESSSTKNKAEAASKESRKRQKIILFRDPPGTNRLCAAKALANFVAEKRTTHQPIWIDLETKFTLENLIVDIIQQLRRYDPGLPPELVALERVTAQSAGDTGPAAESPDSQKTFEKIVRRLYAAMARGRYLLALNGLASFGSEPIRHHSSASSKKPDPTNEQKDFVEFIRVLLKWHKPQYLLNRWLKKKETSPANMNEQSGPIAIIESLGIQDSLLAIYLDKPKTPDGRKLNRDLAHCFGNFTKKNKAAIYEATVTQSSGGKPHRKAKKVKSNKDNRKKEQYTNILICACRRRRNANVLHQLLPKYLYLDTDVRTTKKKGNKERISKTEVAKKIASLEQRGSILQLESGDFWMSRRLRNKIYEEQRVQAESGVPKEAIPAAATLTFAHLDLANHLYHEIYAGSQDAQALIESLYHRLAYLRYLKILYSYEKNTIKSRSTRRLIRKLQKSPGSFLAEATEQSSEKSKYNSKVFQAGPWQGDYSIISENGKIDSKAILKRQLRGTRTFHTLVEQEREALICRVPASSLRKWIDWVLKVNRPGESGVHNKEEESLLEKQRLLLCDLLGDIQVDLLEDHMNSRLIVNMRHRNASSLMKLGDPKREESCWLADRNNSPSIGELENFLKNSKLKAKNNPMSRVYDPEQLKAKVLQSALDAAWALYRNPWLIVGKPSSDKETLKKLPGQLLKSWSEASDDLIPSNQKLLAKAKVLRFEANVALWGRSPWDAKGCQLEIDTANRENAQKALSSCEQGLRVLDEIPEDNRAMRSYFHSLKARSLYFAGEFPAAYRQLDRARSGLSESRLGDLEPLAVALLRQAEALMLQSDRDLINWTLTKVRETLSMAYQDTERVVDWKLFLSREGHHKLGKRKQDTEGSAKSNEKPERDDAQTDAEKLLSLSLANCAPEFLEVLENLACSGLFRDSELPFGPLRSRLDAAKEILDRAERVLEHGRRNVQWWSCLFQLRAQLAIEQLLLLLAGDYSTVASKVSLESPTLAPTLKSLRGELLAWLESQRRYVEGMGKSTALPALRVPKRLLDRHRFHRQNLLEVDSDVRKRFIHQFRSRLRQGLVAVRQGLDILLPNYSDRDLKRLERDVFLRRFLRLWSELLVCGASAHAEGEQSSPEELIDFENLRDHRKKTRDRQWREWLYLNQISGLVHLPSPPKLRDFFDDLYSFEVEIPGLSTRAQTIAKIDYLLSSSSREDKKGVDNETSSSIVDVLLKQLQKSEES